MLNLSLSLCVDPELLVLVERGPNGHKGVLVICSRKPPAGHPDCVCEGMLQPSNVAARQASAGHASALHDDSL